MKGLRYLKQPWTIETLAGGHCQLPCQVVLLSHRGKGRQHGIGTKAETPNKTGDPPTHPKDARNTHWGKKDSIVSKRCWVNCYLPVEEWK